MREKFSPPIETEKRAVSIEIESKFEGFVPEEFRRDPFGYVEREGRTIKVGDVLYKDDGAVREDPGAVKDLPIWTDGREAELRLVAKTVNVDKAQVQKTQNPFYEFDVMRYVRGLGLPAAEPIAKIRQDDRSMILMERVAGYRLIGDIATTLKDEGYTEDEIRALELRANSLMADLQRKFSEAGIERKWKLADMVVDIDLETRRIRSMVPVDWERTVIKPI